MACEIGTRPFSNPVTNTVSNSRPLARWKVRSSTGLLRETYHLLTTARKMEENFVPPGRRVTEFDRLFETGFQSAIQAVVDSAPSWDIATLQMLATEQVSGLAAAVDLDRALVAVLERLAMPFLNLWGEHSRTVRVSVLESIGTDEQWETVKGLIQRYGGDLFDAKFLTLGNLRGILDRGAGAYFDYLRDNPDPLRPVGLIEALDDAIPRDGVIPGGWTHHRARTVGRHRRIDRRNQRVRFTRNAGGG